MKTMSIDIETRSSVDLGKCGVYKYVESPDFDILLFGYSVDGGEVQVVDLACGEQIPEAVLRAVADGSVVKWAFNSSFERVCLSAWLRRHRPDLFHGYGTPEDTVGNYLDPVSWRCSLVWSAYLGLPLSLQGVGAVSWRCSLVWSAYLGLPLSLQGVGAVLKLEDQKMTEGKALIRYFCMPCKPTNTNGGRIWNQRCHDPVRLSRLYMGTDACGDHVHYLQNYNDRVSVFFISKHGCDHQKADLQIQRNRNSGITDNRSEYRA